MSLHKSLKGSKDLGGRRNVLSRVERVRLLKEQGKWVEGDSVFNLPKVKIIRLKKLKKEKEVKEEEEDTKWEELHK